jgi:hypothetical protein
MKTLTIFIQDESRTGTTYITSAHGNDDASTEDLKESALNECADDWDQPADTLVVVGVAAGDVEILEWDDGE